VKSAQPLTVARMTALVARDASFTFGGGTAIAESLRREFVEHRRSITEADFQWSYAASRLTPGTNILALCTVLGWRVGGRAGAAAVLVASSVPTALLVAIAAAGYGVVMSAPGVAAAVRGAVAASVALILASAWALFRTQFLSGRRVRALVIVAACWFCYDVLHASPLTILLGAGAAGGVWVTR